MVQVTDPFASIMREIIRAEALHGPLPFPERAFAILTEEVGESAEALLDLTRLQPTSIESRKAHLRDELVQTAAVVVRMIVKLDDGKWDQLFELNQQVLKGE